MARIRTDMQQAEEDAIAALVANGWSAEEEDGVVALHGATLKTWDVLANGTGFSLVFTVPLDQVPKLVEMTPFLQRLVELKVTRYSRGLRNKAEPDDGVNWQGVDDGDE